MIRYTRLLFSIFLLVIASGAMAQSTATASSPYSKYGLGDITPPALPQNAGMGGIGVALNRISGYNNINVLNPASFGAINFTTIDAGIYSNVVNLNQTSTAGATMSGTNANFRLSHIVFAVPVTKRSALSFGLLPYSEMGYNYKQTQANFGTNTPTDTNKVNYINSGNGGLSKAYLGYGFGIGKHLLIGGNVSYIFGNLQQFSSTEIPALALYGFLNTKTENSLSVGGLNYDYGIQYSVDFGDQKHLIFGYSASANSKLTATDSYYVSHYTNDASGDPNLAIDSTVKRQGAKGKIQLPQINRFGISYQYELRYIIGADYTMGRWSDLTIPGATPNFQNSNTFNIGGQFTPNFNALHNYLARIDYRVGFIYDQTYLNLNSIDIKRYAVTFGLGMPLAPNNTSFYKINFSAEIGKRGTLSSGLVKENYVNLRLGFTLNDRWFQRFKFD